MRPKGPAQSQGTHNGISLHSQYKMCAAPLALFHVYRSISRPDGRAYSLAVLRT
jgi:hypothetical protein